MTASSGRPVAQELLAARVRHCELEAMQHTKNLHVVQLQSTVACLKPPCENTVWKDVSVHKFKKPAM